MASKKFRFDFTRMALASFEKLDRVIQQRILKKIFYWESSKDPLSFSKALTGKAGFFRFRTGDYRLIVAKLPSGDLTVLSIVKIGHRSEVYED